MYVYRLMNYLLCCCYSADAIVAPFLSAENFTTEVLC